MSTESRKPASSPSSSSGTSQGSSKGSEQGSQRTSDAGAAPTGRVQGEGDYEAGRRYNEAQREFVRSGQVEPAARDAKPSDGAQERELSDAEAEGRARSHGEDPAVERP